MSGNLISTSAATGTTEARLRQVRYDLLGRVVRELSGEGSQALATFMAANPSATQAQIDAVWDQHGVVYAYDLAGRKVTATARPNDSQTNITRYYYDNDGRLRFEVNQLGERTEYRYNALGQVSDKIVYFTRISVTSLNGGLLTSTLLTTLTASADSTRDAKTSYTLHAGRKAEHDDDGGRREHHAHLQRLRRKRCDRSRRSMRAVAFDMNTRMTIAVSCTNTKWDAAQWRTSARPRRGPTTPLAA